MKKILFSYVLAAFSAMVMSSCGGNASNAEGEQLEQDGYSVVCPTGWGHEMTGQNKYLNLEMTKMKDGQVAKLTFHTYQPRADKPGVMMRKICREKNGWEYQENKELEDNTWSIAYAPNSNNKYAARYAAFTALKNGVLSVQMENIDISDAEVRQILESVEVKE